MPYTVRDKCIADATWQGMLGEPHCNIDVRSWELAQPIKRKRDKCEGDDEDVPRCQTCRVNARELQQFVSDMQLKRVMAEQLVL